MRRKKRKTTTISNANLPLIDYVKSKIAGNKSYPALFADLAGMAKFILSLFEERWNELSNYFKGITGISVPMPEVNVEVLEDFLKDLYYLSEGKRRTLGSDFLYLFGERLAGALGNPERGKEIGKTLNGLFWGWKSYPGMNSCGQKIFTDRYRNFWKNLLLGGKDEDRDRD